MKAQRIVNDMARIRVAIAQHAQQQQHALAAGNAAQQRLQAATLALRAEELAQSAASVRLDQAKALDARIAAMAPGHEEARRAASQAGQSAAAAGQRHTGKEGELAALRQRQAVADGWLAQNSHLRRSLKDGSAGTHCSARPANRRSSMPPRWPPAMPAGPAISRRKTWNSKRRRRSGRPTRHTVMRWRHATRQRPRLQESDAHHLPEARQSLQRERQQLTDAERLWTAVQGGDARLAALQAELARLRQAAAAAQGLLDAALAQQPGLDAALAQSERALKLAEAACGESVLQLRARLEDDAPCPVCGATDHPYQQQDPRLERMLAGLQDEVARCRSAAQHGLAQQASQRALASAATAQQQDTAAALAALDAALADSRAGWLAHPLSAAALASANPGDWLREQQRSCEQRQRELDALEQARQRATALRDAAQREADRCASVLAAASEKSQLPPASTLPAPARRWPPPPSASATWKRARAASLAALDSLPLAAGWKAAWQADPAAFHRRCETDALAWQAQRKPATKAARNRRRWTWKCVRSPRPPTPRSRKPAARPTPGPH